MIHECRTFPCNGCGDSRGRSTSCFHQIYGSNNCLHYLQTCTKEGEKRIIVCYFTNWAWYRGKVGKFTPDNIDPSLCTHINYAFASLDSDSHTIKAYDTWADIDNKFYELVTKLVTKGVKVLLSIGGWNNSAAKVGWSLMFNNASARAIFVKSVVEFLECYHFHGLDLDYEYPACPQGDRLAGKPCDAENFNQLVRELKDAFGDKYLLTVTIGAGRSNLLECYNIPQLCCIPDWINVMTYDYHVSSEDVVGAIAPIHGSESDWGVYETLLYLTEDAKCPASQLVLGIPFYGQSYTLEDKSKPEFGVKASGPGSPGPYTKSNGTLAYYEICLYQKSGWETGWSASKDSFIWKDFQFVTFDSVADIERKCCLINRHFNLKGAMIWTLDYDDFTNACGCGPNPLLTTLNQQLRCLKVY